MTIEINLDGKKGESLVYAPLINMLATEKNAESLIEQYRFIIDRYHKIEDERLMAIISALIVEDELNQLMSLSEYSHFSEFFPLKWYFAPENPRFFGNK